MQNRPQRLTLPGRTGAEVGEWVLGAVVGERVAGEDRAHDRHVLPQPLVGDTPRRPVPTLDDLWSRDADPDDHPTRRLDVATGLPGEGVDGHGMHRGGGRGAGGDLHHGGAEPDSGGQRGQVRKGRQCVGTVGLGGPHRMVPEALDEANGVDRNLESSLTV